MGGGGWQKTSEYHVMGKGGLKLLKNRHMIFERSLILLWWARLHYTMKSSAVSLWRSDLLQRKVWQYTLTSYIACYYFFYLIFTVHFKDKDKWFL